MDKLGSENQNNRTLIGLGLLVLVMAGLAYASVPLYKLFCQATGFGGTPQIASVEADKILNRKMKIRFDASISGGLNWKFKPNQLSQSAPIGTSVLASFQTTNLSDHPITGMATFNIAPAKAAVYFVKLDCFCFTEQTLQPGQTVTMPVLYYVDPAISEDRHLDEIKSMTLSYTFFEKKNAKTAAISNKEPKADFR
ncbi:MAG: cytochrome c oxidase assembly protein [Robiginitomaculum sp.]|nr:MAG: cytochrome c oxidase assembly protein [Robiginitomaculum sp.]